MQTNIFQEIADSYLNNQVAILKTLAAKVEFPFVAEFAKQTEAFLNNKYAAIKTKKDILSFQNIIDTLDELNAIFLRTADESSYWVLPLIKQFYNLLDIPLNDREILVVNDHEVNYAEGGYGVIVDLFNNQRILKLQFSYEKKIDVFFLPRQSNFSISSIALLAHEAGHVYFSSQKNIKQEMVSAFYDRMLKDNKNVNLFNNPTLRLERTKLSSHMEEYFCDKIGNYLLGPVFDFSLVKILGLIEDDDLTYQQGTHPPVFKRLYNAKKDFLDFQKTIRNSERLSSAVGKITERFFDNLHLIPVIGEDIEVDEKYYIDVSDEIAEKMLMKYLRKRSYFEMQEYSNAVEKTIVNLNKLIPPVETVQKENTEIITPWELVIGAVFYFSGNLYERENEMYLQSQLTNEEKRKSLKQILLHFIKYSINVYSFYQKVRTPLPDNSMLQNTVWKLRARAEGGPFIVVPTIDYSSQYATNAVDLRLGNSFITSKLTEFTHIPTGPSNSPPLSNKNIEYFFEKYFIPFDKTFTLHPHSFVLAVTLEYICIPVDYYALVLGRSTWGRLGLNIATATAVGPGFKGCITLELRNLSEVPITLNVGTRICQICLIKNPIIEGGTNYYLNSNKYICPTEVEYPKIHLDPDWKLLDGFKQAKSL